MNFTRRSMFQMLAAGLAFDPERMLWLPGAKHISIPNRRQHITVFPMMSDITGLNQGDIVPVRFDTWDWSTPLGAQPDRQEYRMMECLLGIVPGRFPESGAGSVLIPARPGAVATRDMRIADESYQAFVDEQKRQDQKTASLYREKGIVCRS